MMKRVWPVLSWFSLATLALFAQGCGEVESCKEGVEPGCLNSPPRADRSCLFDLVLYNLETRGEVCLKPGSGDDPCSLCAEGSLCVPEEGKCVNFCEAPAVLPGSGTSPEEISCRAFETTPGTNPMLSFEEVCKRRCRIECQRFEQFCGYTCPQGTCDAPAVQTKCMADCPTTTPTGGRDLACLTKSCEDLKLSRCESALTCPNGTKVDCTQITCTNDCTFLNDGSCDDGDIVASKSNDCGWGTDCADCGPRKGTEPPGYLGNVCQYHSNCDGGTLLPTTAEAWCVKSESLVGVSRCAPDCSRDQGCEDGFECREVLVTESDGTKRPIVEGDLKAKACFPSMCL